jgi:signal transduction histidine kinase
MRRSGGSISVRLAIGFMLVLAVFGGALLVTLYNLQKVKDASEDTRIRQEIRREAADIGRRAEELFACQQAFVAAEGVDWTKVSQFHDLYRRVEDSLQSLLARPVDEPERGYLQELGRAARRMREIFLDKIVTTKLQADMGMVPAVSLDDLQAESRSVLDEISDMNERLAYAFEIRTLESEFNARSAWTVSVTMAKVIFPVALVICLLIIYYTHRSIVSPVGALLAGTKQLARGNLNSTIDVGGTGEFSELADGFNRMASTLATHQKQLVEAEKMASVGRLAAGVAHEINNPIAVILGYSKMLLGRLPEGAPEREQLETVAEEARQCKNIVDGLLDLSRPSDPTAGEVINPNDLIAEVMNTVQALQLTEGVQIEESVIDRSLPLSISRGRLRQLALNIVRNALEALRGSPDGRLKVEGYVRPRGKLDEASLRDASPNGKSFLVFVFSDNGPGIPSEALAHLFEPFFTTKADGTGLGLAISRNIARAHGGFIQVESAVHEGTTFTVGVPLTEEA